jgi:2-polyprenyl-6-methoxyphenol hydroxylase-like FAD-dependent oxidoreductase
MTTYDAIIVGARTAGAATALGLARRGHRVLVLDRDRYGADTLSTHALQRAAVVLLERWGLLDALRRGGTPAIDTVSFLYQGADVTRVELREPLFAPRRTVLDPLLADAAAAAGADVRWRTSVQDLLRGPDGRVRGVRIREPGGAVVEAEARFTVGADGRGSRVAQGVAAATTHRGRHAGAYLYTHLRGMPHDGYRWLYGQGVSAGIIPTDDQLTTVFVGSAGSRFDEMRQDPAATVDRILRAVSPAVADEAAAATRVAPIRGFPGTPAWLRHPHGPGWALVGDAGSFKDPISSHGITDAFKDAELLVDALDQALTGARAEADALAEYARLRDEMTLPLLRAVEPIASHALPVTDLVEHHLALSQAMQDETTVLRERFARADTERVHDLTPA